MGKNSSSASGKDVNAGTMKKIIGAALAVLFLGITVPTPGSSASRGGKVPKTVQSYISDFRGGIAFNPNANIDAVVGALRFDKSGLSLLARELAVGSPEVRQSIANLLQKIGIALDKPTPDKFAILRDHRIMRILIVEGLARDDAAADAAITTLKKYCTPSDLAAFRNIFVESLQRKEGDYLSLVAKAKITEARPLVQELASISEWRENEADFEIVRMTLAALGDASIEDEFIRGVQDAQKNAPPAPKNRFYNVGDARDGTQVAAKLGLLGFIGTRRSLLVACSYLRSPLKSYVPEVSEKSVRYAALDAIRYNFPDERILHRPVKISEWAEAEKFCTTRLGAEFEGPTPDLPIDQAYPTRVLPLSPARF